ncbi:MAG: phage integrase SAM-like domain-containing protein [Puia sp.]|nr:phage integrase SAM-like domain-containing protein [Puia sp.]
MRQPIKLILKKGRLRNDGTRLISIQYCHSVNRRVVCSTGLAIPPQYWNRKTGRILPNLPSQFGNVQEMEAYLSERLRKAEDMVTAAKKKGIDPMNFLKVNFPLADNWKIEHMKEKKRDLDVYNNIDDYIEEKKREVSQVTLNVIRMMKEHLRVYEKYTAIKITFDSFDFNFYQGFVGFLTHEYTLTRKKVVVKGLRINSIGKTIKWLKTFLKNRMAKNIIPYRDLSMFRGMEEDADAIYLNWREISSMYSLDLTINPMLEKVRDTFVLGCLTGFRFSDYSTVKPEEFRDGMLFVTQAKTGGRVVVPLRPEARAILEKYEMLMPKLNNVEFNFYIKEVARLAGLDEKVKISFKRANKLVEDIRPKHDWVMSHTCRRSFCTNEFLDGTPITLIMAISGHKTEKAFRKYIKADNLEKAQMIRKLWGGRSPLSQSA